MKRTMIFAIAFSVATIAVTAQVYPVLIPKNAKSMAMGGVFTSIATAEFSFFGNPAAFAVPKGTLTVVSTDAWAYIKPTISNIASSIGALQEANPLPALARRMPGNGGLGGGASASFGYAGNGLGLGAFATTDNFGAGYSIPGAVLTSDTEVGAVIGLGLPFQIFGSTLNIGGDIRPFYRARTQKPIAIMSSLTSGGDILDQMTVDAGFGLAMDLGASLQLGSFGFGFAVRDIAPSFPVWTGSFNQLITSLKKGTLPSTTDAKAKAVFLPSVTAGMSWNPRLWPGFVDPALYLEFQDPVAMVSNWDGFGSALNLLHAGVEVRLLSFLMLRGGINRGWLSAGGGVRFAFFDMNAAVFTEELGALPGDRPRSGLSVQAAVRF